MTARAAERHLLHTIAPVYDQRSRLLILGSFPSAASREQGFFYGHPRNRFWQLLAALYGCPLPASVEQKRRLLLEHQLAVWDVVAECDIRGSADSSIRNVRVNDIGSILAAAPIERIALNGQTAARLYRRYCGDLRRDSVCLPSTSPANAACSTERLCDEWRPYLCGAE
ncbi:MAG: DNA-deoxyinosine glycosylase [Bacillota bacterium]|nr:DNA-deoxyinosine glycosylase [Bacillota bacterium]